MLSFFAEKCAVQKAPHNFSAKNINAIYLIITVGLNGSLTNGFVNPFKPNGFFQPYYLEESILHFRDVRLIFSSLA